MGACVALIVAAGRGIRFGGACPKQYAALGGPPVLRRTIEAFHRHPAVSRVSVVIRPGDRPLYDEAAAGLDLPEPVAGGDTRQESVRLGLEALTASAPGTVLIHDGARPLASARLIARVCDALARHAAVLPALPVTDTLKRADADGRVVRGTVARAGLWRAQTPQGFRFEAILAAHRAAAEGPELTDDAAVAEAAGIEVALVEGEERNLKITTADDLARAALLLGAGLGPRTGTGFDVHRFGPGDGVMLCGVRVPHGAGLVGHSDADVGLHALTDALLGALGAGDIGQHFPPSDPRWRGADSGLFLARARDLVAEAGGLIAHVDVTLVCERPKVGPHRAAMVARLAEILRLPSGRVSVKATTTEGLGFTGRGEGIAAQAVATCLLPDGRP
ncbi:MAG TPA: bifunctional 2-C-methyl-D-erythritol 4-phosphate cytidylyltransferase/2-C-methyl-D-erythritol 2,4-cyclodiphosphate synthase [Geminicoccaceae bacterium]|nr:bifunctional 2-C-methyl-D-erythritol 4-phosphate cytidylyltransferase/2-C-methyl-D-erythritol 2,4-cyclodiphosphate synthase [Geminicoccaceae bacterium]